jgi:putative Ca2+/H+ antiporter (TMEM165/GDT1 family)
LTQVLTANMAARYGSALSVAVGAILALWTVAALAAVGGRGVLKRFSMRTVRRATGVILVILTLVTLWEAAQA